jgi:cysteine desulfurase/selenocysteine lyase
MQTTKTVDWKTLREDFPILDQKVHGQALLYLDNAATSQKPRAVIDALRRYYERDNANVHRGLHELSNRATAAFEAARVRAAKFLNARSAEEIIFTRGTTEGINLVAAAWGTKFIKRGDKILLTEMEHHSNIVPWQLLAERTGAQLAFLPINGDRGLLDLGRLDEFLTSDVKLLAMTHISNSLGTINPSPNTANAPAGAASLRSSTRRRVRAIAPSTCSRSAAISSRSPATKCAARPASACCTAGANGSKKPRRIRAAAR